jgi:RNA polymerase sigma-70 factor (ECF subfamily)
MQSSTESILLDSEQFERLFFEYQPRLVRFAVKFVDEDAAEDIVQNCFLRLWNRRENTLHTNVQGLLFTMVRNECLNELKHRVVASTDSLDVLMEERGSEQLYWQDFAPDAEAVLVGKELQQLVDEALMQASDKSREIFILSRKEELKPKEIAEQMGISRQAVEKHIHTALDILKKYLLKNFILMVAFCILQLLF